MVNIPSIKDIRGTFYAYDVRTGKLLWVKGKNSRILIWAARRDMLQQILSYAGHTIRMLPFAWIALGDGAENTDPTYTDLVSPLMQKGKSYDGSRRSDLDYAIGEWKIADGVQVQKGSTTNVINIQLWFTFGAEDVNDFTITEWGLFTMQTDFDHPYYKRHFLNRNHLAVSDQFTKTSTMLLRVSVQVVMHYE